MADIARRRKVFIYCLVSIWDTLVASTAADSEIQARVASATAQLTECLAELSVPRIFLPSRATFQPWILEILTGLSELDPSGADLENFVPRQEGPENSHAAIGSEAFKTSEVELYSLMTIVIEGLGHINNLNVPAGK